MPRNPDHDAYYEANRASWDEATDIHVASEAYSRAAFLRNERPLDPVNIEEIGGLVAGKRLLHLQCHFGMDTLNWARLGATVTGIDFSPHSIEAARALASEAGVPGRFIEANVYDAPEVLPERFDIVYVNVGALCWLPDVRAWAQVVARFLEPGGFLYLYEGHPVLFALDDTRDDGMLALEYDYFEGAAPQAFDDEQTYTDGPPMQHTRTYQWGHGLGEIVTAIIDAGLTIDFLHEHREAGWHAIPNLERIPETQPERWRLADRPARLPLMYSLKATKPLPARPSTGSG